MYNVLLVDDEPWVILGLRKLIDWQTEGFEIIGEATNGIAAYDMIQKYLPNVVITDIRMPGMKGLDLIRKVKELSLETEFIIISGYSEFSYAQEAVKLGAFDYLLKEVDEKILLDSLRRIKLKIRKREKEGSVPLDSIFLETMFNLIERGESEQAIRQLLEARGLDCAHPCFCVVNIVLSDDSSLINGVEEIFEYNYLKIRVGKNKYTFLLNIQDDQLGFLKNPLINSGSKDILAGISSMQDCCISYNRLYYEADVALNGFFTDPVSSVHMYKKQEISKFLHTKIVDMEIAIKESNRSRLDEVIKQLLKYFYDEKTQMDQVTAIYNQIVSLVMKYYSNMDDALDVQFLEYDQLARKFSNPDIMLNWVMCVIESMQKPECECIGYGYIKEIIQYIDMNITQDLLLSEIARKFNISLGYLSTSLKKVYGKTYSEYVTIKRLEMAKNMLQEGILTIQEIVGEVGYKDYFYFNKLFKKHFGITPSKYRKI